jgi:hypothetical protein
MTAIPTPHRRVVIGHSVAAILARYAALVELIDSVVI